MAMIDSVHIVLNNTEIKELVLETSFTSMLILFPNFKLDNGENMSVMKLLPQPVIVDRYSV